MIDLMDESVAALRRPELESAYEQAYREWEGTADAAAWEVAIADGLEVLR